MMSNPPEMPSTEEVQYLLESATVLSDEIDNYRSGAETLDDDFLRNNEEKHLSLDDMPYGEELIRIKDFPHRLNQVITQLQQIQEGKLTMPAAANLFQNAESIIENIRNTLDECTPLPKTEYHNA